MTKIDGNEFIKPIDEKEEIEFENAKKKKDAMKSSLVQLPSQGIPENKEEKVSTMTAEEQANMSKQFGQSSSGI